MKQGIIFLVIIMSYSFADKIILKSGAIIYDINYLGVEDNKIYYKYNNSNSSNNLSYTGCSQVVSIYSNNSKIISYDCSVDSYNVGL